MTVVQDPPVAPGGDGAGGADGSTPARTSAAVRPARPRTPSRYRTARRGSTGWVVRTSLFWLAAVCVAFAFDIVVVSQLQYAATQARDYATLRNELANALTPVSQTDPDGVLTPVGTPVAALTIPRLGLADTVVVEGTSGEALQRGPGHERDSVFPGQAGVSIIQGRRAAFGGPFSQLTSLRVGDQITAVTGQGTFTFRVIGQRREGDPIPALQSGASRLTLVTAAGAPFAPSGLVRVDAALVGEVTVDPSVVYARDLPTAEQPLGSMPETLPTTILGLQALLIAVLGAVWAWLRWGKWRTWLVFGPVLLLATVLLGGRLSLLLPNLL